MKKKMKHKTKLTEKSFSGVLEFSSLDHDAINLHTYSSHANHCIFDKGGLISSTGFKKGLMAVVVFLLSISYISGAIKIGVNKNPGSSQSEALGVLL